MEKEPLFIAHRGDTVNFSENTMEAFEGAFDKGADGIELDVHLSDAGEIIVVHNYLYDRSQKYPTLDEVLSRFATRGRIEIEIKELEEKALVIVQAVVNKYRPFDVEVTTSVQPLMQRMSEIFSSDRRGLIFRRNLIEDWMPEDFRIKWLLAHLHLTGANVLHLDFDLYTPAIIESLHTKDILSHTHIKAENNEEFERVRDLGIDQFTFDDIELLRRKK